MKLPRTSLNNLMQTHQSLQKKEEVFQKSEVELILLRSSLMLRKVESLRKNKFSNNSYNQRKDLISLKLTLITSTEGNLEEKRWS